jgi:hypothetical protein
MMVIFAMAGEVLLSVKSGKTLLTFWQTWANDQTVLLSTELIQMARTAKTIANGQHL